MRIILLFIITFFVSTSFVAAQTGILHGEIFAGSEKLAYVTIKIKGSNLGTTTNEKGEFTLKNVPIGTHVIEAQMVGFETYSSKYQVKEGSNKPLRIALKPAQILLDQMVVTGTKTVKRSTESAIIVNVIDASVLENVQACNLSEGLKFQPGLRVETDCQTCNYTQLRMNGLGGGYSQILINGRPIFSPLTGLYGLEQIPANMIERIEIVRGGASALYGSSAIGGTVNVITKLPKESEYSISQTFQRINNQSNDNIFSGNATVLTHKGNSGASVFVNSRSREMYDHNGDNYSELPELKNQSFGTNLFFQPTANQKIEVSISHLNEYRYGGEMVDKPAYLTQQSEERTHNVWLGSVDYQNNFNNDSSSFIVYFAGQSTNRDHYTGIMPDDSSAILDHLQSAPYGVSTVTTIQGGVQFNQKFKTFNAGSQVATFGAEYLEDDVYDVIESYNYKIDQLTKNLGLFAQSDWEVTPTINLLTGIRMDKHNLVDHPILSPRASLLYKLKSNTQFRFTWGTGFRAPQAFDSDMHIAFAGGGISRISLADDLKQERPNSFSGSINYDLPKKMFVAGFTVEGFYTHLNDAFYLHPIGQDSFGERFEKRNGDGATVQGLTLELRGNYNRQVQLEAGITVQTSEYDSPVLNIDELEPKKEFMRTPNVYGYSTLSITPNKKISTALNLVYTGPMEMVHFAGAPEQTVDAYHTSSSFLDLGLRVGYTFLLKKMDTGLELNAGIKNLTNAYQNNFDTGKNRDSNFIYGPSLPRTYTIGLKLFSL